MDTTGVVVLVRVGRRADCQPPRFTVRRPTGQVGRVLELCGVAETVPLVD